MFQFTPTPLNGAYIIEPQVFGDERGFFMETYSSREFYGAEILSTFVQDNHSKSKAGVLRGLHFQTQNTQAKLVRVIAGSVYDVAVDLRKGSPTYGKWFGVVLSAQNKKLFFIPQGFAHGFLTLEDDTEFVYKCDDFYNPAGDGGIAYNSPELEINWGDYYDTKALTISPKDQNHPVFESKNFYFGYREMTQNVFAYIDMQNVYQSMKMSGFKIDWKRFYKYLKDKFKCKKIYLFLGYLKENTDLYEHLKEWGYELVFREVTKVGGIVKGNVDTELTLQVISDLSIFHKAILVTSDGDFASVVKKLKNEGKLGNIISPNHEYCSNLLKKVAGNKMFYLKDYLRHFTQKRQ